MRPTLLIAFSLLQPHVFAPTPSSLEHGTGEAIPYPIIALFPVGGGLILPHFCDLPQDLQPAREGFPFVFSHMRRIH